MNFKLRWRARLVLRVTWTAFQKMELPQSNTEGVIQPRALACICCHFGRLFLALPQRRRLQGCVHSCIWCHWQWKGGLFTFLDPSLLEDWYNKGYIYTYVRIYIYLTIYLHDYDYPWYSILVSRCFMLFQSFLNLLLVRRKICCLTSFDSIDSCALFQIQPPSHISSCR